MNNLQQAIDESFSDYPTPDIDHPPKQPKDQKTEEQEELFEEEQKQRRLKVVDPIHYDFEISLTLKAVGGKTYKLPITSGSNTPRESILEMIIRNVLSDRFLRILGAVLKQPVPGGSCEDKISYLSEVLQVELPTIRKEQEAKEVEDEPGK